MHSLAVHERKRARIKKIISSFEDFELVFEHRAHLPKDRAEKVIFRMYDWFVRRPWKQQIDLLEDTDYYFAILRSDSNHDAEAWLITRGGVAHGSNRLLMIKTAYRATQPDDWISLHTSINQREARRDIFVHLGLDIETQANLLSGFSGLRQPPMPGVYESEESFFEAVKAYSKCCFVLESAEACLSGDKEHIWKTDLLLLVDDPKAAARFFGLESNAVTIGIEQKSVRLIGIHSGILCPVWAKTILDTSVRDNDGLPVPSPIHHFFICLYFAEFFGAGVSDLVVSALTKITGREKIFSNQNLSLFNRADLLITLRSFILGAGFSIPPEVAKKSRSSHVPEFHKASEKNAES